jgi:uncharacterized protein YecT (DUF1311 family)
MLPAMNVRQLLAALLLAASVPLAAQLAKPNDETRATCEQYLQTPLPAEASLSTAPKSWPECDSPKLYSGIDVKADKVAARKCAWTERLAIQASLEPRFTVASVLGGSAMLSVLYANGEGVDRNLPLALRFLCEAYPTPTAVQDLETRRNEPKAASGAFDLCDDARDTFMIGFCAGRDTEIQDDKRNQFFRSLSSGWPLAEKQALLVLVKAEDDYSTAHARGEIDLGGSGRAVWEMNAEWKLREQFKAALVSCEKGGLRGGPAAGLSGADLELNQLYRKALASAKAGEDGYGAVQPDGIRDAERAWLKYRDAWVAFARLRYPAISAEAWLTLLTKDRIADLKDTFCEMGSTDDSCAGRDDGAAPRPLP